MIKTKLYLLLFFFLISNVSTLFAQNNILEVIENLNCNVSINDTSMSLPGGTNIGDTITSIINITEDFTINDVNITININHLFVSDLSVSLIAPDNTEITLADAVRGADEDNRINFTNTVFDDQAATDINNATGPFTGTFTPLDPLAVLNSKSSLGEWKLVVTDFTGIDPTELKDWTLELCSAASISSDLGVVSISAPASSVGLGNESITIEIENFGSAPQSGFEIAYTLDGGNPVSETYSSTINSGETASYTFTTLGDFSNIGEHTIIANTSLSGDEVPSNDSLTTIIENLRCNVTTNSNSMSLPGGTNVGDTITSIINITEDFTINDVNITINIDHLFVSDLSVSLIAPDNTEITLADAVRGTDEDNRINFTNTVFDDQAATDINNATGPFTGTFTPLDPLAVLNSKSSLGEWKLVVTDFTGIDPTELKDWTLELCSSPTLSIDKAIKTQDIFNIYSKNNQEFLMKLESVKNQKRLNFIVYDVLGQIILSKTIEKGLANNYEYTLNMSHMTSGLYFVRIENNKFSNSTKKIIVR